MPHTYMQYEKTSLRDAVSYVREKKLTITEAARKFNIPRKTLDDHVKGKIQPDAISGGQTLLSAGEEDMLVQYLDYMRLRGFPFDRKKLRAVVREVVLMKDDEVALRRLGATGPTDKWFRGFYGRHPEVTERKAAKSDQPDERILNHWFDLLEMTITRLELSNHPERVYNSDETSFTGKEQPQRTATAERGRQPEQVQVSTNDHVTAHVCVSASGERLPTQIIYKGNLPHGSHKENVPPNWLWSHSDSGCIDAQLYLGWFEKIFLQFCSKHRPVLLICDNSDSRISLPLIQRAKDEKVEILGLPAHISHLLQPLQVGVFSPVKETLTTIATSLSLLHSSNVISRAKLPMVLSCSLDQVCTVRLIKSAFAKCGIIPTNRNAIDCSVVSASDSLSQNHKGSHCPTCDQVVRDRHPGTKVLNLPENIRELFIVPATKTVMVKRQRSKVISFRRVITSEQMECLQKKEQTGRKEKREVAKRKRDERQRDEEERPKRRWTRRRNADEAEQESEEEDEMKERDEGADDGVACGLCSQKWPPGFQGEHVQWITCDSCDLWFHNLCVDVAGDADRFVCANCK